MPRYALKVFYDGKNFAGSQCQPGQRTVEGELLNAFKKLGAEVENFQSAGRTDKGVSALGSVFALTTNFKFKVRAINSFLPEDIRVLAVREVPENFNPRYEANERIYKYFLFDGCDLKKIRSAAKIFEGEHSFHNFCILEGRNPVRKIKKITVKKQGDFFVLTFYSKSFLWQMVRRIVTAIKMVGAGEMSAEELNEYFFPNRIKKIKPSPPENLILWDIKYNFEFEYEEYSLKKILNKIFEKQKELTRQILLNNLISAKLKK